MSGNISAGGGWAVMAVGVSRILTPAMIGCLLCVVLQTVREKCFQKCISKPSSSLSGSESSCVSRCVERYIEATGVVSKAIFQAMSR